MPPSKNETTEAHTHYLQNQPDNESAKARKALRGYIFSDDFTSLSSARKKSLQKQVAREGITNAELAKLCLDELRHRGMHEGCLYHLPSTWVAIKAALDGDIEVLKRAQVEASVCGCLEG